MTVTLSFPPPAKRLSMNDRLHWRHAAVIKAHWRRAAWIAGVQQVGDHNARHRSHLRGKRLDPCFVRVTFPVRDNRRRDADNPAPTVKAIVDGLVDAGVWPDDTPEWVETLGSRFAKGATEVVVELIPRTEARSMKEAP